MDDLLQAVLQAVVEVIWKLPGYLILRCFRPQDKLNPDGCAVFVVGSCFWLAVVLLIWAIVLLAT